MNTREARQVTNFTSILQTDNSGKPKVISVPGHNGRNYEVIVRRDNGLSVECRQNTGPCGHIDCKGNSKSICYHSLAAIIRCAKEQNQEVAICESYQAASRLMQIKKNDKPVIVRLTSRQSGKVAYLVVTGVQSTHTTRQLSDSEIASLDRQFVEAIQAHREYQNGMRYGW